MVKKNERQAIRPDTCSKCKRGKPVKVSMGNPKVVLCSFFNRRFVADSKRNCDYAIDYGILHTY